MKNTMVHDKAYYRSKFIFLKKNILQLRLDLTSFTVSGPSTDTTQRINILNGEPAAAANGLV